MDDLLPCPFCGGPVRLEQTESYYDDIHGRRKWWGVVCRNTINRGGSCAIEQRPSASIEAAVERWNRRTPAPASHEQVEAVLRAASQASFCLRELLPNDEDAKMTVRMLEAALHHQPSAPKQGESE